MQRRVRVFRWRTYPCDGEQVLVCELPDTERIRVTTAIAHWDTTTSEIVTQSGRVYELVGRMAEDSIDFGLALVVQGLPPGDEADEVIEMSTPDSSQFGKAPMKKGDLHDDAM